MLPHPFSRPPRFPTPWPRPGTMLHPFWQRQTAPTLTSHVRITPMFLLLSCDGDSKRESYGQPCWKGQWVPYTRRRPFIQPFFFVFPCGKLWMRVARRSAFAPQLLSRLGGRRAELENQTRRSADKESNLRNPGIGDFWIS